MLNETKKQEDKLRLSVETVATFEKVAETAVETTQRLAKRINQLFVSAFADYHGSVVYCTAGNGNTGLNQQFMVELHFKPLTAGSIAADDTRVRAFRPIEERNAGSDIISGLKSIYGSMRTSAKFELTEDGAQILSEFMLPGSNVDESKPATFDRFKAEYMDPPQFGQTPIMVKIYNLDLIKLIKKIYGTKDENKKKVDYGVIPYGPVMPNGNQAMQNAANWRILIMRVDAERMYDVASEFGMIQTGNGGPIVTGC